MILVETSTMCSRLNPPLYILLFAVDASWLETVGTVTVVHVRAYATSHYTCVGLSNFLQQTRLAMMHGNIILVPCSSAARWTLEDKR